MVRRFSVLGLFVGLILSLSFLSVGCQKAEQPKEVKPAAKVEAKGVTVVEFTFDDGKQKWGTYKNISLAQDTGKSHGGKSSLKIAVTKSAGLYNLAGTPNFSLVAGQHYKFSGWMLVESYSAPVHNPIFMLKVGIYKDGKWFRNVNSNLYNLSKKGEWQLLTVEFTAPSESNLSGNITVEKRPMDKDIAAVIYIDDIVLQQAN